MFFHHSTYPGSLAKSLVVLIVVVSTSAVFSFSCSSGIDKPGELSRWDFEPENTARLRVVIEKLVGTDSAGMSAMQQIKEFEADDRFSRYQIDLTNIKRKGTSLKQPSQWDRALFTRLDPIRGQAQEELKRNWFEFSLTGDAGSAKMALANIYVLINCSHPTNVVPNQGYINMVESITKSLRSGENKSLEPSAD